jgi:drug/metabolite transporter (DMT)-like permease
MVQKFRYPLGVLSLLCAGLIFGSIPTALKAAMVDFSPSVQLAIRFLIGAVALTPFVREFNLRLLRDGSMIGLVVFGCFACETLGLQTISANRAAFIFGLNFVFVTLFELLFRQRISLRVVVASAIAFCGIALMSWEGGEPGIGNLWLLLGAICDATSIILLEKFAPQYSAVSLSAVRVWCVAILGLLWAAPDIVQQFHLIQEHWQILHYLGIIATAVLCLLYTIGMQWVPAYQAAFIIALEPLFGAMIAFLVRGETFGYQGMIGALLMLFGVILVLTDGNTNNTKEEPIPVLSPVKIQV